MDAVNIDVVSVGATNIVRDANTRITAKIMQTAPKIWTFIKRLSAFLCMMLLILVYITPITLCIYIYSACYTGDMSREICESKYLEIVSTVASLIFYYVVCTFAMCIPFLFLWDYTFYG